MKIGFTNGCFDILHIGHVELFKFAKSACDYLIVALDTDNKISANKGPNRPFNALSDRIAMVTAIRYVDEVRSFASPQELDTLVDMIRPDVMVVGSDYEDKEVVGSQHAKKLLFFRRLDGYSTTKILENTLNR